MLCLNVFLNTSQIQGPYICPEKRNTSTTPKEHILRYVLIYLHCGLLTAVSDWRLPLYILDLGIYYF